MYDADALRQLVRPDRVHRSVYRDPEIFELEMQRIFGQAWLYVGHESQVANVGDFFTTTLGTQPVVMSRDENGDIHVIYNRCGHRGAVVCNEASGNADGFRCCYHGWAYKLSGDLAFVPLRRGYPAEFDLKAKDLGMVGLPRVAVYRGFIFASHSADGPDLVTFLGPIKDSIDGIVEAAPDAEIDLNGGVHRYEFAGNWKYQVENIIDMYHPPYSHESTMGHDNKQFARSGIEGGAEFVDKKGVPIAQWDDTGVRAFPNGHGFCGPLPGAKKGEGKIFEEYRGALEKRLGSDGAAKVLDVDRHNSMIYPNLVIQTASQHVRVVEPVSVDRTIIRIYPVRLKGAPDAMYHDVIRYLNYTHSPAALIQTDDLEGFRRINVGLNTQGADWVVFGRGLNQEIPEQDGGWSAQGTSEICQRNQYDAWTDLMVGEA